MAVCANLASSSAARMAPTRPSIMSDGATTSAPAAAWVTAIRASRDDYALVGEYESPVELGELLDGLAHVRVVQALLLVGMPGQRVQDQGPRVPDDLLGVSHHEERADLAPLSALARDLHRELHDFLERPRINPAPLGADLVERIRRRLGPRNGAHFTLRNDCAARGLLYRGQQAFQVERTLVARSVDEEGRRPLHPAALRVQPVLPHARGMPALGQVVLEARQVQPDTGRVAPQGLVEVVLVLKEEVVHLPEPSLGGGRLGGLG